MIMKIFKRDVKRIIKNPIALMVIIGVCFLPSLYAWFNIAANMDPYSNTGGIKVAVANNDQPAIAGEIEVNAGEEVVLKLKENTALGWQFMDTDAAIEGVKSGEYYAAIVIPKDFSSNIVSILSGNLKTPVLDYYINEKKNAIAPKITDTGAGTVQQQINDTFSAIASESIADTMRTCVTGVSEKMEDASINVQKDIRAVQDNINDYQKVIDSFSTTASDGSEVIQTTIEIIDSLDRAAREGKKNLNKTSGIIQDTRDAVGDFSAIFINSLTNSEVILNQIFDSASSGLTVINDNVQSMTDNMTDNMEYINYILSVNQEAIDAFRRLNSSIDDEVINNLIDQQIDNLQEKNDKLQSAADSLQKGISNVSTVSSTASQTSQHLQELMKEKNEHLLTFANELNEDILPEINTSLDAFSVMNGSVSSTVSSLAPSVSQLKTILNELDDCLSKSTDILNNTSDSMIALSKKLDAVQSELSLVSQSKAYQEFLSFKHVDSDSVSDFMSSPVNVTTKVLYGVKNYGSGMTPFYTNLALWVGGIILVSILKQEVDEDETINISSKRKAYIGRYLLFVLLGVIQGIIVCAGDIIVLKVQCVEPALFILAGAFCSFVYVSLIYVTALTFKHVGKAICVILVILQIPGSSGTYPIEMMPQFFKNIYPVLPFTYGISAMRECIAGMYDGRYLKNLLQLSLFLLVAAIIGFGLHPLFNNLNYLFDKKVAQTDLILGEENGSQVFRPRKMLVYKVLLSDAYFKKELEEREQKFEKHYKKRVKYGFLTMFFLPMVFLVLMFNLESKLIYLVLWIGSLLIIALFLIINEYLHDTIQNQKEIDKIPLEEIKEKLRKGE